MSGQPNMDGDLERAEPGPSTQHAGDGGQREGQVMTGNATTTPGDNNNSALVAAWMQRLQMLTLITTFLASVDGELFVLTSTPSEVTLDASLVSQEFVYACFTGALVFHVCAAILGYVASFALIRYKIVDIAPADAKNNEYLLRPIYPFDGVNTLFQMPSGLQVKSRTSTPPLDLLTRCYFTTLALSGVGFILALLGIAGYAWVVLRQVVGIFTTACLGVSIVACVWAVL